MIQAERRQARDEQILSRLDELTYATRKQLQILEGLGGERNAQRIIQRLEREKYISSIRQEMKIYFLNKKGQRQIGSNKDLNKKWIRHTIMRNDLYIKLGMPADWQKEVKLNMNGELFLVADAMYSKNGINHFVEIDNQNTMNNNAEKIRKYKELFNAIFNQFKHHPVLIWYTLSDVRKEKLNDLCSRQGIKFKIY